jgi:hypothetical protein
MVLVVPVVLVSEAAERRYLITQYQLAGYLLQMYALQ